MSRVIYVALGDSITFGYDATTDNFFFPERIRRELAKGERTTFFKLAKPGWTSNHLLQEVKKVPECIWEEASVITLLIGGNDLLRGMPVLVDGNEKQIEKSAAKYQMRVSEILDIVTRPQSRILLSTIYNPFPFWEVACRCMENFNGVIKEIAKSRGIHVVDLHRVFQGHEQDWIEGYQNGHYKDLKFRRNPIHPNNTGHTAIATEFLRVYRTMSVKPKAPVKSKRMKRGKPKTAQSILR